MHFVSDSTLNIVELHLGETQDHWIWTQCWTQCWTLNRINLSFIRGVKVLVGTPVTCLKGDDEKTWRNLAEAFAMCLWGIGRTWKNHRSNIKEKGLQIKHRCFDFTHGLPTGSTEFDKTWLEETVCNHVVSLHWFRFWREKHSLISKPKHTHTHVFLISTTNSSITMWSTPVSIITLATENRGWTKEFLMMVGPEHVMGLAIGNELELLHNHVPWQVWFRLEHQTKFLQEQGMPMEWPTWTSRSSPSFAYGLRIRNCILLATPPSAIPFSAIPHGQTYSILITSFFQLMHRLPSSKFFQLPSFCNAFGASRQMRRVSPNSSAVVVSGRPSRIAWRTLTLGRKDPAPMSTAVARVGAAPGCNLKWADC